MIKRIYDINEIIDFVYELSLNDSFASYPRMKSVKRIKKELSRALKNKNQNIIANIYKNELYGVCCYHWNTENKYAQASIFLIKNDYDKISDEFISYIKKNLSNHDFLIGIPVSNKNAIEYFNKKQIQCIESSIVTNLKYSKSSVNDSEYNITKITIDSFEEYSKFHDKYAIPNGMYYNSKNLLNDIARFEILSYKENGKIIASIFACKGKELSDVMGLFIEDTHRNRGIEKALINGLLNNLYKEFGSIFEILYFIDDYNEIDLKIALDSGFEIKERYKCYEIKL